MACGEMGLDGNVERRWRDRFWTALLVLMGAGLLVGGLLQITRYVEVRAVGKAVVVLSLLAGTGSLWFVPVQWRRWKRWMVRVAVLTLIVAGWSQRHAFESSFSPQCACAQHLQTVGRALQAYSQDNGGFLPYAESGQMESLALLYPAYVQSPSVFLCPSVSRHWFRRHEGSVFPPGTPWAGARCHYTYEPRTPPFAEGNRTVMWDLPANHRESGFVNALHIDGTCSIRTAESLGEGPQPLIERVAGRRGKDGRLIMYEWRRSSGLRGATLDGDYGMMVFYDESAPGATPKYELYLQKEGRIVRTSDLELFIKEIASIPRGEALRYYRTCCGGTSHGLRVDVVGRVRRQCQESGISFLDSAEDGVFTICTCE